MKTMHFVMAVLGVWGVAVFHAACSGTVVGRQSGGETNWLADCATDGACSGGDRCLCGVCTKACTGDSVCGDDGVCSSGASVSAVSQCETPATSAGGFCLRSCPGGTCPGSASCVDGICIHRSSSDASVNGTGGAGGADANPSGGSSGAGGSPLAGGAGGQPLATVDSGRVHCTQVPLRNGDCLAAVCDRPDDPACIPCDDRSSTPAPTNGVAVACTDDPCSSTCQRISGSAPAAVAMLSDGGYPTRQAIERYGATCAAGTLPQWDYFTYSATTPGSSRVDVTARFEPGLDAGPPVNVDLASVRGGDSTVPMTCSFFGAPTPCYVDVAKKLASSARDFAFIDLTITETPSGSTYPSLAWWELRYSCVPNPFVGTCQALGRIWSNGAAFDDGCNDCTCSDGRVACTANVCETCTGADAAACPPANYCNDRISCGTEVHPSAYCTHQGTADCAVGGTPACGCDGKTYASECDAHDAGVAVQHPGACDGTIGCWPGELVSRGTLGQCLCDDQGQVTSSCRYSPGGG